MDTGTTKSRNLRPSLRDHFFLLDAILFDIHRATPGRGLDLIERNNLGSAPYCHVVIQRDYTTVPVVYKVVPVAEFDRNRISDEEWSAALNEVISGHVGKVICCAVIPHDHLPYKILWLDDVSLY